MDRIRVSIDGGIVHVRDRVKAEYDGRLDRMEGVVRRYQSHVDKVASENRDLKAKLVKMERERKQWEEGAKKKEEEMKRRRKREEVAKWRRSKEEKTEGRGKEKEGEDDRLKDDRAKGEREGGEKQGTGGTAVLLHQKLGLVSKQLKIVEMTLQGLLPLLPRPGAIDRGDERSEPHKLVGTILPGLLSLLKKIDTNSPNSSVKAFQVLRSINLVAFHLPAKKPYTMVTKSVVLRTPDIIKDFLDSDDFRVRFEAATAVLRFGLGGEIDNGRSEILNKAAETLSIETSLLPSSPNPPQTLVNILGSLELLLGMVACTRGEVVTQGNKIFLHAVSCCNSNNRFKNSTVALLTSNDLLKNFLLDLYASHTAVKEINVIRSMLSEVREVFSMVVQIIGTTRPSWVRNVKGVIEEYVRSGDGGRFELVNLRSALEALEGL